MLGGADGKNLNENFRTFKGVFWELIRERRLRGWGFFWKIVA